jgi:putative spermidine/putrescine transport system substrate-binding protein
MKKIISILMTILIVIGLTGCGNKQDNQVNNEDILNKDWETILENSKGSTVTFYGWGGDEKTNKWIDTYVAKEMKDKYDINVKRVGMDINDILNKLLSEKQVKNSKGNIDVVWINGENFKTAKDNELLFGPFTDKLPNMEKYIDKSSPDVTNDFGTPVDKMEAPYGKAQFTVVYDSTKINEVPTNHEKLLEIAKANPGKFTYPALPDFTGSAFVRNIIYDVVGYENVKNLPEDKEKVKKAIQPAMDYLNELKPYLWKEGKTYPSTSSQLDNMYADGEVLFSMTYTPNSLPGRINDGEFPKSTKTVEFDKGNISNTHFLAIPFNAPNKEAAMILIDFLESIDAQASKSHPKNWGDAPVIDMSKLNDDDKKKFGETIIIPNAVPELPANLVPIIEEIWMEQVAKGE